ncbi:hypothetical protein IW138_005987 [Coemansia sp. RSA 986]|nr:hypothetical protein IW138_005987 [Coemansia sp. RSA 986]
MHHGDHYRSNDICNKVEVLQLPNKKLLKLASHAIYREHPLDSGHEKRLRRESNQQLQPESLSNNSEDDSQLWKDALGVCTRSEVDNMLCEVLGGSPSCQPDDSLAMGGHEPGSQAVDAHPCTPENRSSQPSAFQGSPRTRISGRTIQLGLCGWAKMIDKKATFVDKSAAIADVMSPDTAEVIAGMYPRRMGKTTFLQTLANFLDIIGDMPRSQREKQFRKCAVYELHPEFFEENFAKYPVIMLDLKNNDYLHKGILVGVFDVRGIGLGSGLNNVESYMAHSGFAGTRLTKNPFQHAFGFTINDVWGLINDYVDNQWPYRATTACLELGHFKRDLLVGCIQHFDGYRIGQVHHVFNPYAILCLIRELRLVKSLADVDYSRYSFWTETGSMKVVETIKASSAHDLSRYCEYLSSSFLRQSEYRQHQGSLAEHMSLDFIDDTAVGSIGSQEQPQFPPDVDKETREELADICMVRSGDTFHDMQSLGREPLQASTIMRLLYQAGYIVPIAKDRVGIPNSEVHRALEQFYERVAAQLKISTSLLESIHEEMRIYKCDLQRFSRSLHSCMVSIPGLGEDTSERFYQTILSSYLFPATRSGYAIQNEAMMENGRADTLLFPAPGHLRLDSTPTSYYIFELKSYDGKTTPTTGHASPNADIRALLSYPTLANKARKCDLMHVVGISFWMNRFCMVVTRRKRAESANGAISWPAVRYEGGIEIRDSVDYEQLGDRLEDAENGILREIVVNGHFVALTI